jgi:predicted phage terminase large subunit-like protein
MPIQTDEARKAARIDLAWYAPLMWPKFRLSRHHELLIDLLERIESGACKRAVVAMPPRHGKSLLCSILFPAWYLGRNPKRSVICGSYGQDLSDDFGRQVRQTIADQEHQAIFPGCKLSTDSNSLRRFGLTAGGKYFAVGRGGPLTGRGANLLILDDLLKDAEEARSETVRRNLQEWFSTTASTRLTNDGAVLIIATRWHQMDLSGYVLDRDGKAWETLTLPAIAEQDEPGFRKEGEALWPEMFPLEWLEQRRQEIGANAWTCLYQQNPVAAEGNLFRREWWQYFRELPPIKYTIQAWDTAFSSKASADYSVCVTFGVCDKGFYVLDVWRGRVEFPELKRQFSALGAQWKPNTIIIEEKASGQSLLQELKRDSNWPVLGVKADTDKISRASAVTSLVEAGRVHLPDASPWLATFTDELAAIPNSSHDDQADAFVHGLNYLRKREFGNWTGLAAYYRTIAGQETQGVAGAEVAGAA